MNLKEFILLVESEDILKTILFNPTKKQLILMKNEHEKKRHNTFFQAKFFAYPAKREMYVGDGYNFIHYDLARKAGYLDWENRKFVIGVFYYNDNKFEIKVYGEKERKKERLKAIQSFTEF